MANFKKSVDDFIVLDSNQDMSRIWAEITTSVERNGRHIAVGDAWNAATAIHYNIPLVSHNRKDYESVSGLQLVSMNKS